MTNFTHHLRAWGLSEHDANTTNETLHSWSDLVKWMDAHPRNDHHAPPKTELRTAIGAPHFETSYKDALKRRFNRKEPEQRAQPYDAPWIKVVDQQRKIGTFISLGVTLLMTLVYYGSLIVQSAGSWVNLLMSLLYPLLTYIGVNQFWKQTTGSFKAHNSHKNPYHPSKTAQDPRPDARVAILFPVYHEDPQRVMAGMAATWESIQKNVPQDAHRYDFYLLSDSRDSHYQIGEQAALGELQRLMPEGRFYYRWRPNNANAKLGNMVDWFRRLGNNYRYCIVMDADSLMNGNTIHSLLRMMEGNDRIGILQTNPTPILRQSLFGRIHQFSGRLYGSALSNSLQAVYMGHANYIGHNAIIRVKPFMDHCMLPDMSGKAPWGGKPLSHDLVEAALMARAGYEVWLLPELEGSYEEIPANLQGFLMRERRWMQGNLQHLRLIFTPGLRGLHRENFFTGIAAYASCPIWAVFLALSMVYTTSFLAHGIVHVGSLANVKAPAIALFITSMIFLFIPRIYAVGYTIWRKEAHRYGGIRAIIKSLIAETFLSILISPIIMIFLTKCFIFWALRKSITWSTQQRDDAPLSWTSCKKDFGWISAIGIFVALVLRYTLNNVPADSVLFLDKISKNMITPGNAYLWFAAIFTGPALCLPLVRFTSRSFPLIKKMKFFMIPEEVSIPDEITTLHAWEEHLSNTIPKPENTRETLHFALSNPEFLAQQHSKTKNKPHIAERLLPKIHSNTPLTRLELNWALKERQCFNALILQNNA